MMRLVLTLDDATAACLTGAADAWQVTPKHFAMALLAERLEMGKRKRPFAEYLIIVEESRKSTNA